MKYWELDFSPTPKTEQRCGRPLYRDRCSQLHGEIYSSQIELVWDYFSEAQIDQFVRLREAREEP